MRSKDPNYGPAEVVIEDVSISRLVDASFISTSPDPSSSTEDLSEAGYQERKELISGLSLPLDRAPTTRNERHRTRPLNKPRRVFLLLLPSPTLPKPPRRQLPQPIIIHPRSTSFCFRKRRRDPHDLLRRLRRKRSRGSFSFRRG